MENKNMPMPGQNKNQNKSDVSANISSSLSDGVGPKNSTPDGSVLDAPSHDIKPILTGHNESLHNEIKISVPKEGIRVVATEKGFFGQHRKSVGDQFIVPEFEMLGEWMRCEERSIEKKRLEFFKKKKAKK